DITANGLVFTIQPVTTPAGQPFNVKVEARDASGNTDPTFTGAVTLAIKPRTGASGATLGGTTTVNAVAGVADFSGQGLNIQKFGTGYILTASTSSLPVADSAAFDITAAPASQLVVTASPLNTQAGRTLTMTVEARDAFGNLDTAFAGTVDVA